jgi:hypothetical protein
LAGRGRIEESKLVPSLTAARLFNFDIAQHQLKPEHKQWLKESVVGLLRDGGSLWVMGLTSRSGSEAFNLPLSQRRAHSVIEFCRSEVSSAFASKVEIGFGEAAARISGLRDGTEDAGWRAVVLSAWNKSMPPPPPPPPPRPIDTCKRVVVRVEEGKGVRTFTFIDYGSHSEFIPQVWDVKATEDYRKCATTFEQIYSFLAAPLAYPVIYYTKDTGVFEVVGHYIQRISGSNIHVSKSLPLHSGSGKLADFLNGYSAEEPRIYFKKLPVLVSRVSPAGYENVGTSDILYDVVTDIDGKVLLSIDANSPFARRGGVFKTITIAGIRGATGTTTGALLKKLVFF